MIILILLINHILLKCKTKPYTKIQFKPDYKRLGLPNGLTPDMINLFRRRVYDIAAVTNKSIKVKFNSTLIPIKNFQQYIKLIDGEMRQNMKKPMNVGNMLLDWLLKDEFTQVSFVNGIYTSKGGKHIEYIMNQIVKKLAAYIKT